MACEKCWGRAYLMSLSDPSMTQAEHYHELIYAVMDEPEKWCTLEEQRGETISKENIDGGT
jgi:hypothetical protein